MITSLQSRKFQRKLQPCQNNHNLHHHHPPPGESTTEGWLSSQRSCSQKLDVTSQQMEGVGGGAGLASTGRASGRTSCGSLVGSGSRRVVPTRRRDVKSKGRASSRSPCVIAHTHVHGCSEMDENTLTHTQTQRGAANAACAQLQRADRGSFRVESDQENEQVRKV